MRRFGFHEDTPDLLSSCSPVTRADDDFTGGQESGGYVFKRTLLTFSPPVQPSPAPMTTSRLPRNQEVMFSRTLLTSLTSCSTFTHVDDDFTRDQESGGSVFTRTLLTSSPPVQPSPAPTTTLQEAEIRRLCFQEDTPDLFTSCSTFTRVDDDFTGDQRSEVRFPRGHS